MVDIDFINVRNQNVPDDSDYDQETVYLMINGNIDEDSTVIGDDKRVLIIYNDRTEEILFELTLEELKVHFDWVKFNVPSTRWLEFNGEVYLHDEMLDLKFPSIVLFLVFDLESWSNPYTMVDYVDRFKIITKQSGIANIKYWQESEGSGLSGFGIYYHPEEDNTLTKTAIEYTLEAINLLLKETDNYFENSNSIHSVITKYKFPSEVQTACNQYLIYFTQFMADLGIGVDIDLRETINETLFKVTPKDKNESLQKIREALDIFLNSPTQNNFSSTVVAEGDIAVQQWASQVFFLQSQLMLAKSTNQANQIVISSLQIANYQLQQTIDRTVIKKEESQPEKIVWGLVTLKKFDAKVAEFDLPEIYRRMKRLKLPFKK